MRQDAAQKASENAKFLSGVQSKLRDQALSLAGRLEMRDLTTQNAEFTDFQKDMTAAAASMGPASGKLQQQKWKDAMPDEQKALQHLLRAEATFRRIQVAFGNAGGGGGGAGTAGRDLASLFDLELDTQKNQYEVGQTAESATQRAKDIDDALRKLDELARRQEELASQQRNGQSSDQRWQQEMLRRQAEELQKQIEQLSRNGSQQGGSASGGQQGQSQGSQGSQGGQQGSQSSSDARVQQALNQLRQANDDMRRAASQQQSQADARRAAERLKEATSLLGGAQQQQSSARLDGLANEADPARRRSTPGPNRAYGQNGRGSARQLVPTEIIPATPLASNQSWRTIASAWPTISRAWKRTCAMRFVIFPPEIATPLQNCATRCASSTSPTSILGFNEALTRFAGE